ncbi:MAG: acyl-CoA dehydrogenase family protein [Pseudomonas sp.]
MSALQHEDRVLIQTAVDKFIQDHYAFDERQARLQDAGPAGRHWRDFAELGWLALPLPEAAGGLGGGIEDVQLLMRAFGRGLIAEPFTEVVLMAGKVLEAAASGNAHETLLADIASGSERLILAADFETSSCAAQPTGEGYRLDGTSAVVVQAGAATRYLVGAQLNGEFALFLVPRSAVGLTLCEYPTIDSRSAGDLTFDAVLLPHGALVAQAEQASRSLFDGLLFTLAALVAEAEGIAAALTEITAGYLKTREQFGVPIASFQALQHLYADMVLAEEEIRSLAWLAANALHMEDRGARERTLRAAKARTGKLGMAMAETAVQLHGGIGVSDEYVVGHYLRRMIALDATLGSADEHILYLAGQY